MYHICFVCIYPLNGYRELNSFEEPCFMLVATITSFAREPNPTEVGEHTCEIYVCMYVYILVMELTCLLCVHLLVVLFVHFVAYSTMLQYQSEYGCLLLRQYQKGKSKNKQVFERLEPVHGLGCVSL